MTDTPILVTPQIEAKPANNRIKFILGALIIFVGIAILVANAFGSAGAYYMEVDELLSQSNAYHGERVRVSGVIVGDSVDFNSADLILKFNIGEGNSQLPVYFHGPRPDNFQRAAEAIVEGEYGADGVLYANSLLLKCPSRYEDYGGEQKPADYEEFQVESIG